MSQIYSQWVIREPLSGDFHRKGFDFTRCKLHQAKHYNTKGAAEGVVKRLNQFEENYRDRNLTFEVVEVDCEID